jgi:hypothetical protein
LGKAVSNAIAFRAKRNALQVGTWRLARAFGNKNTNDRRGSMEAIKPYADILADITNLIVMVASALAIYVFFANRTKISAALNLLLNYSFQTTLSELKEKLEMLNKYSMNDSSGEAEIRNILHEITGQIRGNSRLSAAIPELISKIENLSTSKKLTEPLKRSLVSELREQLKTIQVNNVESFAGRDHE